MPFFLNILATLLAKINSESIPLHNINYLIGVLANNVSFCAEEFCLMIINGDFYKLVQTEIKPIISTIICLRKKKQRQISHGRNKSETIGTLFLVSKQAMKIKNESKL